jgi:hypothetical protein
MLMQRTDYYHGGRLKRARSGNRKSEYIQRKINENGKET